MSRHLDTITTSSAQERRPRHHPAVATAVVKKRGRDNTWPSRQQGQRRIQPFEEQMMQFMGDNKRLLQFHEQKLLDLEAFKSDTQMFQKNTSASLKNLETQVGQLALNVPNQNKGTFPSDTQKNPKDCMVIQLRSGKDLSSNKETEAKKEKTEEKAEKNSQLEQLKGSNDKKKKEGVSAYTPTIPFPQRLQKSMESEVS